ncbi:ABC transporter permease subunit [Mesorhizobium sp. M00.F.Ca.ET.217.01.1.1]|uniref:ABC transporter permease subunit n=1 Tax=Mesorhizobium sp. M00.F.Ca.ET.217.01.1.1 TaxID=2500529 RepID=UPI000FD8251E|nr:ABC transporter permease subunit [Mesorhizobium sp. M00.F.Ca.ET.217.01.1.1]TGQ13562.1 ABC transporter permease subunit [Mesorhizobium sp. M00.F.Ca.ET.217.01.1.1]TGV85427.1 ABC transporter permease subunit [Mesorhizobium sp. M00.F.Ca.ET.158.01.1.1]
MSVGSYTERPAARAGENDGLSVPWSRPRRNRRGVSARVISATTLLALLAAWAASAELQLVSPVFLPSPAAVWAKFVTVARDGFVDATLLQHVAASLWRVFAALIEAIVIGVPVGLAIGISRIGRGVFDPLLEFLRPIPPLAYLPLIVIWFGIGEPSKILVIAIAMLAPMALSTAAGVRGVSRERIDAARSLGATRRQVVRHVMLPSALPSILTGLRIALGAGWSTLVAAELVAATRGLGFMIQSAAQFLVTDVVVMGILVIATIAFALEFVIRRVERALVPWAGKD